MDSDVCVIYWHEDRDNPLVQLLVSLLKHRMGWRIAQVASDRPVFPVSRIIEGTRSAYCTLLVWGLNMESPDWPYQDFRYLDLPGIFILKLSSKSLPREIPPRSIEIGDWAGDPNDPRLRKLIAYVRSCIDEWPPPPVSADERSLPPLRRPLPPPHPRPRLSHGEADGAAAPVSRSTDSSFRRGAAACVALVEADLVRWSWLYWDDTRSRVRSDRPGRSR